MYSRASDGHEPNNLLFSPCSKRQIALVISRKGTDCFIGKLYIKAPASTEAFLEGGSYFLPPLITTSLKMPAWEASYT